jgi:hypothetical protein
MLFKKHYDKVSGMISKLHFKKLVDIFEMGSPFVDILDFRGYFFDFFEYISAPPPNYVPMK